MSGEVGGGGSDLGLRGAGVPGGESSPCANVLVKLAGGTKPSGDWKMNPDLEGWGGLPRGGGIWTQL